MNIKELIIDSLHQKHGLTERALKQSIPEHYTLQPSLNALISEGFVIEKGTRFYLV